MKAKVDTEIFSDRHRIVDGLLAHNRRIIRHFSFEITRNNTEGLILNMQKALTAVKRNQPVLATKGLKPELVGDIETQMQEIDVLNVKR